MTGLFSGSYQIILTLALLGLLILLHELGHFLMCRLSGINVEKFSIGFGKEIWSFKRNETTYVISIFPFGGYVRPQGEDINAFEGSPPKKGDYLHASVFQRLSVVVAGPAMNWILAWILFTLVLVAGRPVQMATIGDFMKDYPAETSGLMIDDRILEVDGKPVRDWIEMTAFIREHTDGPLALKVKRSTFELEIQVAPKVEEETGKQKRWFSRIGIKPDLNDVKLERFSPPQAFLEAAILVWEYTSLTYHAIFGLITRELPIQAMSGPIGVVTMAAKASAMGLVYLIQLSAMLSISLAVFNMLPIPALDGGHVLFLLIETIKRKPLSLAIQERSTQVCFILLITLFVVITFNDITRLPWFERLRALFLNASP